MTDAVLFKDSKHRFTTNDCASERLKREICTVFFLLVRQIPNIELKVPNRLCSKMYTISVVLALLSGSLVLLLVHIYI